MSTDSKPTILNVDDNPSGRYVTTHVLEREGFHVKEAATGNDALRLAKEQPDLILLDVNLPDVSGFEVCRRLKEDERTRSIPVLHLSATATSMEDRTTGLTGGADAYLTQPVDPGLLVATIKAMLRARRAEKEGREAAGFWQATFDAISHGVCLIDQSGLLRQVNRGMCALLGKDPGTLIGKPYHVVYDDSTEPQGGWVFERARKSGRHESAEVEVAGRWFHVTADPLFSENGEFAGAVRTMMDITGRKRADEERDRLLRQLESERARIEAVLRQMPAGVIMADAPSGKIVLRNEQVESILRGPFRVGGGPKDYLQYAAHRPGGRAYRAGEFPLARTIASGEVVSNEEIHFTRGDGSRATVLVSSAPIRNREGYIIAGIAMLHDVTERNQLEHQLRQSQKMDAMGRLAGGVAHDFNNLLTIIGGYGQMALESLKPKDPLRGDLEAILEASNRAAALTRQLLTFSRRQIVQPKVVDLNREVTKISRMLRRVIGEDVELTTSLKADPARIKIDPAQLEQVLLNVAVNAREAMPKGGKLSIETASVEIGDSPSENSQEFEPGRYVMIAMTDTGAGMDAETLSHLFEPFYTTKGKGKGTGLGLPTVYGIVKQGGGDISIDSELGRGTAVRIYLPVAGEPVKSAEAAVARPFAKTGTETVLVVEDEAEVRRLANEMLTRQGYAVLEAASGAEALRVWQERDKSIDLVLTDVIMPQMSGPELAGKLKALCPGVKVLYMSGYTDDVIARHGVLDTKTAFLHKPFTLDSLAQKVRAVLDEGEPQ